MRLTEGECGCEKKIVSCCIFFSCEHVTGANINLFSCRRVVQKDEMMEEGRAEIYYRVK